MTSCCSSSWAGREISLSTLCCAVEWNIFRIRSFSLEYARTSGCMSTHGAIVSSTVFGMISSTQLALVTSDVIPAFLKAASAFRNQMEVCLLENVGECLFFFFIIILSYCYTGTSLIHLFKTKKLFIRNYLNIIYSLTDPYLVCLFFPFSPVLLIICILYIYILC